MYWDPVSPLTKEVKAEVGCQKIIFFLFFPPVFFIKMTSQNVQALKNLNWSDSVNKTWTKWLICMMYWEKSMYFKSNKTKHLQAPVLLLVAYLQRIFTCWDRLLFLLLLREGLSWMHSYFWGRKCTLKDACLPVVYHGSQHSGFPPLFFFPCLLHHWTALSPG